MGGGAAASRLFRAVDGKLLVCCHCSFLAVLVLVLSFLVHTRMKLRIHAIMDVSHINLDTRRVHYYMLLASEQDMCVPVTGACVCISDTGGTRPAAGARGTSEQGGGGGGGERR